MLFAKTMLSEQVKFAGLYVDGRKVEKGAEERGFQSLLKNCDFARRIDLVIESKLIPQCLNLANFLRFPAKFIEKHSYNKIDENILNKFSLRVGFGKKYYYDNIPISLYKTPYTDGDVSLFLFFEDKPLALISFDSFNNGFEDLLDYDKVLVIQQIQGIKPQSMSRTKKEQPSPELKLFNWRKALVEIGEELSKMMGYNRIGIIPSKQNLWFCEDQKECEEGGRYYKIYDQIAIEMGYILNGIFKKVLK